MHVKVILLPNLFICYQIFLFLPFFLVTMMEFLMIKVRVRVRVRVRVWIRVRVRARVRFKNLVTNNQDMTCCCSR